MGRVASFHLVRERPGRSVLAIARLSTDRIRLARTPGAVFTRLLGTGKGADTGPSADLSRTALFAIWRDEADLDRFLGESSICTRWERSAEVWHVRLRGRGGHGSWHGVDVLGSIDAGASDGPVAIITRADVARRSWPAFRRAGRNVSDEVRAAAGLLAVVGIGEAPVGRLGTFSVWRSLDDVAHFTRSMPHHRDAVRRTRAERWYGEELFARFEPYASTGTWDGCNPLADLRDARRTTGTSIP